MAKEKNRYTLPELFVQLCVPLNLAPVLTFL